MRKTLPFLSVLVFFVRIASAQDFPYGNVTLEELRMKNYAKDTTAHAVVLQEYGKSSILVTGDDDLSLVYLYHVKIKIFDSKGFDEATEAITLRNDADNREQATVDKISGTTYYLDDGGSMQKTALDPSKKFITRDYKYQSTLKFTMPALNNGCIVEYRYRVTTPLNLTLDHFHPWYFQSDIPKVYSEYEAVIPGHFTYNAKLTGFLKLTKTHADILSDCFSIGSAKSDCSDIQYGMSDIPAFKDEEYMTSPKNYLSAITFDLVEYTNPYNGEKIKETKDWSSIDRYLHTDESFGSQLKKENFFKDRMVPVVAGAANNLGKAEAVYHNIQHWFKWDDYIGYESADGIKKAFDAHSGSIADINLSLIDALKSVGIPAEPVLLSTRDNGVVNEIYPALNDFNYIIAKATVDGKNYFLDASDPQLAFGMLPLKCLNGKGRVFSLDSASYWVNLNLPQKEISTTSLDLTLQDDGKIKGTITVYSIGYEAYKTRKAIKKFTTTDDYVDDLASHLPKVKILKSEIDNLDSLDRPVVEKYQVEISGIDKVNSNEISFNPFFLSKITTNPFKLTERLFPVDMGMPGDYRIMMTMHLPADYEVASPPQSVALGLPNNGGKFMTEYEAGTDNSFIFSHVIQFYKSIYSAEEYPYLKEFYNKIIQSEMAEMLFKKKT